MCPFPPRLFNGTIDGPGDHEWYSVLATGGVSCVNDNDFGSTFTSGGVVYDVISNRMQIPNLSGPFTSGPGFYDNGTLVYIHVHQAAASGATISYSGSFHL